ncbi:flavodoxin domain-containing protein, partial [Avibacterium paragallinarum]
MKILILYSSYDGQSKKIAEVLGTVLQAQVEALDDNLSLTEFDCIVIGASIRYGHFNKRLYKFIEKHTAL